MGRTTTTHVVNFVNFFASSAKQRLENVNDNGYFFKIYISNLALCSILSFEIALTARNKLNDFRVSRDS